MLASARQPGSYGPWSASCGDEALAEGAARHCKVTLDNRQASPYKGDIISSFTNKALQRFFETGKARGLSVQDDKRVARILRSWEAASRPEDMDLPGYRFHGLVGQDKGRYSVSVTGNWRITFGWDGEHVTDVDLEDYH